MAIQYLYTNADKFTPSFYGWYAVSGYTAYETDLYSYINEGVSYAEDSGYIGHVFTPNVGDSYTFGLGNISIIPSSITLRLRHAESYPDNFGTIRINKTIIYNNSGQVVASKDNALSFGGTPGWQNHSYDLLISGGITNYDDCDLFMEFSGIAGGPTFTKNLQISALDLIVSGNTLIYPDNQSILYIGGNEDANTETTLYVSGEAFKTKTTTLYTINSENINSGMDLYLLGGEYENSSVPLHIQLCEREARLQPLYDNESSPSPTESGYQGWLSSNSYLYNGIDDSQRWGFRGRLEDYFCTDKYHFNVDEFDNDDFYGVNFDYADNFNDIMFIQYLSNMGIIYGNNNLLLTNAGFTTYGSNSGHLGYGCGYFADTALFNNTQNNGYGYRNDISLDANDGSGIIFDDENSLYMWFKVVDNGNSGDKTYLFSIANNSAEFNPPYPYNEFSVFYEVATKSLIVKDDSTEQIITSDLTPGWHLIGCDITRIHYYDMYTAWHLDGQLINGFNMSNDVSSPIHSVDGKRFYIGKHFSDSNVGNTSFVSDYFGYTNQHISDWDELYNFYRSIQRPTSNYFDYIGCSGYSEILCSSNCSNRFWGDTDYLYSQPPLAGDSVASTTNYIYFYDGYNTGRTEYETHNIIDFQSRGLTLQYGPYDASLRFRADIDTPFKVKNIYVKDENGNTLSQKTEPIQLDGYGTCGPYEILLDTQYFSSGTFHPARTRMYADFYVDTGCLNFIYPTGLTHASQTDNNFRNQYRNHRTFFNGTTSIFDSGKGIENLHIVALDDNDSPEFYKSDNTFGYEFSGISDTTNDKYLGLKLTNYDVNTYSGYDILIEYRLYGDFASGNSSSQYGSFNISTENRVNFTSGDITYWSQLPDYLNYESGFQIGFYVSRIFNFGGDGAEEFDVQLSSPPFIYIDTTNKGVSRLGQVKLTQLDVAFEIPCIPTGINDVITLYVAGVADTGVNMPLYTSGMPHGYGYGTLFTQGNENDNFPLFLRGGISVNMPLYINGYGGTGTNGLTLYLDASDSGIDYGSTTNNTTLFIKSISVASGDEFDLFIKGPDSGYLNDNLTLYIEGYGGTTSEAIDLYIDALDSGIDYGYTGGFSDLYMNAIGHVSGEAFSLYISAPASGFNSSYMPLFLLNTDSWSSNNSGTILYLQALESGCIYTSLFMKSIPVLSGDPFNLYISGNFGTSTSNSTLFINGEQHWSDYHTLFLANATPINNDFNLYVKGTGNISANFTSLSISGNVYYSNDSQTLFISGEPFPFVSGELLNLYINGGGIDNRDSTLDLFMFAGGDVKYPNSITFHTIGGFEHSELPLLLYNDDIPSFKNNSATLYAGGFSGVLGKLGNGVSLYINAAATNDNLNLYLHNDRIESVTSTMPLYLGGKDISYSGLANWTTLYVHNESQHIDNGTQLFLYATQSFSQTGDFNLFIARNSEAIAGNTSLYLAATNGVTHQASFYTSGATYTQNNINFSIPYVESFIISESKLYTHGI